MRGGGYARRLDCSNHFTMHVCIQPPLCTLCTILFLRYSSVKRRQGKSPPCGAPSPVGRTDNKQDTQTERVGCEMVTDRVQKDCRACVRQLMLDRAVGEGLAEKVTLEAGHGSQAHRHAPSPLPRLHPASPGQATPNPPLSGSVAVCNSYRVFTSHYFIYLLILLIPFACNGKKTSSF